MSNERMQFLEVGQIIKKSLMKINSRIISFLFGVIQNTKMMEDCEAQWLNKSIGTSNPSQKSVKCSMNLNGLKTKPQTMQRSSY